MRVREARSIDELYAKTKDYDIVLSADPPLVDGLNSRISDPRLGHFAATPKNYVKENTGPRLSNKREIFRRLLEDAGLGWKEASYALENVVNCWEETGSPEKILDYERFATPSIDRTVNFLLNTDNIYSRLNSYKITDRKVAVVASFQLNELDKKILPDDAERIEPFKSNKTSLPKFRIFDSEASIVRFLAETITPETADEFAIIVAGGSKFQPLVESFLAGREVPYMRKPSLSEDRNLRDFLNFCRLLQRKGDLKLNQVRPLLTRLDISIPRRYDDQYLKSIDIEGVEKIFDLTGGKPHNKISDVMETFEAKFESLPRELTRELEHLGLPNRQFSETSIDFLEYYLDLYDPKLERKHDTGVLLGSATSSAYVDRPVVLHLGLDSDWVKSIPGKPWRDGAETETRDLKNFQLLLQNGTSYFIVLPSTQNTPVTPCYYFNELSEKNFTKFENLPNETCRYPRSNPDESGFSRSETGIEPEPEKTISQSDLNTFVKSPRDYLFSRIIEQVDKDYLRKGTLFHDFAELYLSHGELVEKRGDGYFADIMVDAIEPFVEETNLPTYRTEFLVGIRNIRTFLDSPEFAVKPGSGNANPPGDPYRSSARNLLAKRLEVEISTEMTEVWFENEKLGSKGKIDLLVDDGTLVDYKSSKNQPSTSASVVKDSSLEPLAKNPDFQAKLYLAHQRERNPGVRLRFFYYYFLGDLAGSLSGEGNWKDNLVEVIYYPREFPDQIPRRDSFEYLKSSNKRKKMLEGLGYDNYRDFFLENRFSPEEGQELEKMDIVSQFVDKAIEEAGDYKYVKREGKRVFKKLLDYRQSAYFKEDLDAFNQFLSEQLHRLNEYKKTRFPMGDADRNELNHKDLIIGDD